MTHSTPDPEAHRQYTAAHGAHYGAKDLGRALDLYRAVLSAYPESLEAGYSRSQILNLVKAVVPEQELFAAQVGLVSRRLGDRSAAGRGVQPLGERL